MLEKSQHGVEDLYLLLGGIKSSVDDLCKQSSRITLALIGVIAAQIGVKVLGTPPLLDIATTLGIVGIVLLLGALTLGWRVVGVSNKKLTGTGRWLASMMAAILITQVFVYFRDLRTEMLISDPESGFLKLISFITPNFLYGVRIVQNVIMLSFAWAFMKCTDITKDR